ncbi:MAG TPA: hypothetical protein VJI75_03080 [Candidatus Nanoarchaeia archaeon]|nr:hypothetical protein [Candidatus Nanoarchaeia archaeon]
MAAMKPSDIERLDKVMARGITAVQNLYAVFTEQTSFKAQQADKLREYSSYLKNSGKEGDAWFTTEFLSKLKQYLADLETRREIFEDPTLKDLRPYIRKGPKAFWEETLYLTQITAALEAASAGKGLIEPASGTRCGTFSEFIVLVEDALKGRFADSSIASLLNRLEEDERATITFMRNILQKREEAQTLFPDNDFEKSRIWIRNAIEEGLLTKQGSELVNKMLKTLDIRHLAKFDEERRRLRDLAESIAHDDEKWTTFFKFTAQNKKGIIEKEFKEQFGDMIIAGELHKLAPLEQDRNEALKRLTRIAEGMSDQSTLNRVREKGMQAMIALFNDTLVKLNVEEKWLVNKMQKLISSEAETRLNNLAAFKESVIDTLSKRADRIERRDGDIGNIFFEGAMLIEMLFKMIQNNQLFLTKIATMGGRAKDTSERILSEDNEIISLVQESIEIARRNGLSEEEAMKLGERSNESPQDVINEIVERDRKSPFLKESDKTEFFAIYQQVKSRLTDELNISRSIDKERNALRAEEERIKGELFKDIRVITEKTEAISNVIAIMERGRAEQARIAPRVEEEQERLAA